MATRKFSKELVAEWTAELRAELKPGDTLYTVLRHVSASGMSRRIDVYRLYVREDGKPDRQWLTPRVAAICGYRFDDQHECLVVGGCGMDMGFEVVYSLGRKLWPEGFAPSPRGVRPVDGKIVNVNIGRGRKAGPLRREEIEELTAKGWIFLGGRNGDPTGWDNDGGYALKQEWL